MAISQSSIEFIKELLAPFGDIRVKKMFGGAGLYYDDLFFALLDDDTIYLKVDDENRPRFEEAGLSAFTFEFKDGKTGTMSYFGVPDDFYDDEDERRDWVELALGSARRALALKPSAKKPTKRKA